MTTDTRTIRTTVITRGSSDALYLTTQVIWMITAVVEVFLILRVILEMLGSGSTTMLGRIIYIATDILLLPFTSLFGTLPIGSTGIEGSALLALGVYLAIGAGVVAVITDQVFSHRFDTLTRTEAVK